MPKQLRILTAAFLLLALLTLMGCNSGNATGDVKSDGAPPPGATASKPGTAATPGGGGGGLQTAPKPSPQ
jgi:hypothetical protein